MNTSQTNAKTLAGPTLSLGGRSCRRDLTGAHATPRPTRAAAAAHAVRTGSVTVRSSGPDCSALDLAMMRYARGDAQAFAALHRALHPRLTAFLLRMTGSRALADDLVQETFLRVHRARANFVGGGSVVPWAYRIARNVHLDHLRSRKRCAAAPAAEEPQLEQLAVGATAESSAIASETARIAEQVLARLPASQREAFCLLACDGLSVQAAAAALGASQGAIKVRAFRAREALRAELGEPRARVEP